LVVAVLAAPSPVAAQRSRDRGEGDRSGAVEVDGRPDTLVGRGLDCP
jgi:hypothetical protein